MTRLESAYDIESNNKSKRSDFFVSVEHEMFLFMSNFAKHVVLM